MVIDNEKLASLLEKCADYIEASEQEKVANHDQRTMIVKQASEIKERHVKQRADSAKEVLSSLLNKDVSDEDAQKFAQSDIGIELLSKISNTAQTELGVVSGGGSSVGDTRSHWGSFASQLLETT